MHTLVRCFLLVLVVLLTGCSIGQSQTGAVPITHRWTETGDDGNVGTATVREIRFAETEDSLLNHWSACRLVPNMPAPKVAGTIVVFQQPATLTTEKDYWFAIRAADNKGNWNAPSGRKKVSVPDTLPPAVIVDYDAVIE